VAEWDEIELDLLDDHGWTARPGHNFLFAVRGAVRFEFPEDWLIKPRETTVRFHDAEPPNDRWTLEITISYFNDHIDWDGLPIARFTKMLRCHEDRNLLDQGDEVQEDRRRFQHSWFETRSIDPQGSRSAESRLALARFGMVQPLLTYDFWAGDADWAAPVWDVLLDTFRMGDSIAEPREGPAGP
jgi:hypothetical protein